MASYECCYSGGRQYVFVEKPRWLFAGVVLVVFLGVVAGLAIGVAVSLLGVVLFELSVVAFAIFAAVHVYVLMFQRVSSTMDSWGYVTQLLIFSGLVIFFLGAVRYSMHLELDVIRRCLLFSSSGVVSGLITYTYACVYFEDERKHQLTRCGPNCEELPHAPHDADSAAADLMWDILCKYGRFLKWILRDHTYQDLKNEVFGRHSDEEIGQAHFGSIIDAGDEGTSLRSCDCIIIFNRTLKQIKVCLYAYDDVFCWIPVGGISGSCVGFIPAEQSRAFHPPRLNGKCTESMQYQVKVFQPGFFDKELACYRKAERGMSFAFLDVEGVVRRSRLLSHISSLPPRPRLAMDMIASSESEDEISVARRLQATGSLVTSLSPICQSRPCSSSNAMKRVSSGGNLKRVCSGGNLQDLQVSPSHESCVDRRRATPEEVVIRNRSNQEIRASLFRADDYLQFVSLVGVDCIETEAERRFNPPNISAREFTLKVYSVGAASKELTYFTVTRGQTYTFCDSLLS